MIDTIKDAIPSPCKEGIPFILGAFGITVLLSLVGWDFLAMVMFALSIWVVYFFRDPERVTPEGEGLVVSPADGVISMITKAAPPAELEMGTDDLTRISVFLNVFNVHVNRVPVGGKITNVYYYPGKFLNASLDKASEENERNMLKVTTEDEKEVGFVQIAGLVARRIVCHVKEGDDVTTGQRFGLIRFGSRMDVYLPKGTSPQVVEGQIAVAGETIFASLKGRQSKARTGVTH